MALYFSVEKIWCYVLKKKTKKLQFQIDSNKIIITTTLVSCPAMEMTKDSEGADKSTLSCEKKIC